MRKAILLSILFVASHSAFAQSGITLRGTLKDDKGQPVANTQISVSGDAFSNTKPDGQFTIALTNQVVAGQTITLLVSKPGWIINDPVDGKWNAPSLQYFAAQSLPVIIVRFGDPALLTPARLNEYLSRIKDELTRKLNEARQQTRSLAARDADNKAEIAGLKTQVMTDLLRQWENDYGLTVAKMEEVISQYARTVNPADDNRTKGLKAFQNGDYDLAADYFEKAALQDEDDIARKEAELELERLSAYKNWKATGDSQDNKDKYELAIAAYDRAARYLTAEGHPQDWAELEKLRGNARIGLASLTDTAKARQLLTEALHHYRNAGTIYTGDQFPQDWAKIQLNFGNLYQLQAQRAQATERLLLLDEAEKAYRNALTVNTQEKFPQDWAATLNNLGNVISGRAEQSSANNATQQLNDAITAYRSALKVLAL